MSIKIIGTGRCVPKKNVTNKDLESFLTTSDEWITTRTGISSRYISTDETLCELSSEAASKALKSAGLNVDDIDLIVCSTMQGDFVFPSLACMVQKEIGASCPSFDINAACSGFIYALDVANAYISAGRAKNVLIISSEMMSKFIDWEDRATCVLFGDGSGACVVTSGDALKYIKLTAQGKSESLYLEGRSSNNPFKQQVDKNNYTFMDGQDIFKFAVSTVERETAIALESANLTPDDISYYLLHQANKRIIESARNRVKQDAEKFPTNIDRYGNTSSASIPILLDEMVEQGKIKSGDKLLMTAFGAGLTSGTCILEWV